MEVSALKGSTPNEILESINERGLKELTPPQELAIKKGLLSFKNIVVSSPTACYDRKTEVLTKTGWRLFKDVAQNEEVLSMNPTTLKMEYVRAKNRVKYFYRGMMVHVQGKEIDFRVTENHNMFVHHRHKLSTKNPKTARFVTYSGLRYDFHPAREIRRNWKFVTNGVWKGRSRDCLELPPMIVRGRRPLSKGPLPAIRIKMRKFLDFFGWYIAEGHTKFGNGDYEVTLCQRSDPQRAKASIVKLGLGRVYSTGTKQHLHFSISNPQLARYLSQFGKAYEKFVPGFIKELLPAEINIFLKSYFRGDGHIGRDNMSPVFNTTSKRLADDIQELLLKVGVSSSVRLRGKAPPHNMPDGHTIISKHPTYEVAGRRYSEHGIDYRKRSRPSFELTRGEMVYCLSLPRYHLLYVRRNGKALWCGNSGKTLIAEIACVNTILSKRKKAIYIAPMRAIATEKFNEFQQAYPYIKTAISIGDLDSNDPWLAGYSMMFFSTEKFDSLLRHGINWLGDVGCIIFDEVHMLDDPSRGPTLEILMTKLANTCDAQLIALSATIANCKDIAKWLGAELVESDYRPVRLVKGVVHDNRAYYRNEKTDEVDQAELMGTADVPEVRITQDTLLQKKQALVFYSARRNAEAGAARISHTVNEMLGKDEKQRLEKVSDDVLTVLERPTEQCKKLSQLVRRGVAFHHAGLMNKQRAYIEDAFKAGLLKVICATPTLAYGVNLPAHTVVVRDTSRYEGGSSERLGVNEVTQLFGRAGRPKYDKEGRALLIASTKERIEELYRNYITAKLEPVESALGIAPVMRTHILAFVAQNFLNSKKAMQDFLAKSFYSYQYHSQSHINNMIDEIVDDLTEWEFISTHDGSYSATKIGERVSQLYIDPLSAKWMIDSLQEKPDDMGVLFTISNTLEMRPHVRATKEAELEYTTYAHTHPGKVMDDYMNIDYGYYDPVKAFSTALMLSDWMNEMKEPDLVKKYNTTPGGLYGKMTNADWLMYSAAELARLLHMQTRRLVDVRVRLRYGIKEELLDLVRLEQIGRVRARLMFNNGIRSVQDIRANRDKVARLLGKEVSQRVFEQLV